MDRLVEGLLADPITEDEKNNTDSLMHSHAYIYTEDSFVVGWDLPNTTIVVRLTSRPSNNISRMFHIHFSNSRVCANDCSDWTAGGVVCETFPEHVRDRQRHQR